MHALDSRVATIAAALVGLTIASLPLAGSAVPYSPNLEDFQEFTPYDYDNGQFSTIDAMHVAPDGLHLDITWRVGQDDDIFVENYGLPYPRVMVIMYTNDEGEGVFSGRVLGPIWDSIRWWINSDHDAFVRPFLQTGHEPNEWLFYEKIGGGDNIVGDMRLQTSLLHFDHAENNVGIPPNTYVFPDGNGFIRAFSIGIQIDGPIGMSVGESIPGHVVLSTSRTGDYNLDGVVDAADFTVWRDWLGRTDVATSPIDGDGSGVIDVGDYVIWKNLFNRVYEEGEGAKADDTSSAGNMVPEPAPIVLFAQGALVLLLRLQRRDRVLILERVQRI